MLGFFKNIFKKLKHTLNQEKYTQCYNELVNIFRRVTPLDIQDIDNIHTILREVVENTEELDRKMRMVKSAFRKKMDTEVKQGMSIDDIKRYKRKHNPSNDVTYIIGDKIVYGDVSSEEERQYFSVDNVKNLNSVPLREKKCDFGCQRSECRACMEKRLRVEISKRLEADNQRLISDRVKRRMGKDVVTELNERLGMPLLFGRYVSDEGFRIEDLSEEEKTRFLRWKEEQRRGAEMAKKILSGAQLSKSEMAETSLFVNADDMSRVSALNRQMSPNHVRIPEKNEERMGIKSRYLGDDQFDMKNFNQREKGFDPFNETIDAREESANFTPTKITKAPNVFAANDIVEITKPMSENAKPTVDNFINPFSDGSKDKKTPPASNPFEDLQTHSPIQSAISSDTSEPVEIPIKKTGITNKTEPAIFVNPFGKTDEINVNEKNTTKPNASNGAGLDSSNQLMQDKSGKGTKPFEFTNPFSSQNMQNPLSFFPNQPANFTTSASPIENFELKNPFSTLSPKPVSTGEISNPFSSSAVQPGAQNGIIESKISNPFATSVAQHEVKTVNPFSAAVQKDTLNRAERNESITINSFAVPTGQVDTLNGIKRVDFGTVNPFSAPAGQSEAQAKNSFAVQNDNPFMKQPSSFGSSNAMPLAAPKTTFPPVFNQTQQPSSFDTSGNFPNFSNQNIFQADRVSQQDGLFTGGEEENSDSVGRRKRAFRRR